MIGRGLVTPSESSFVLLGESVARRLIFFVRLPTISLLMYEIEIVVINWSQWDWKMKRGRVAFKWKKLIRELIFHHWNRKFWLKIPQLLQCCFWPFSGTKKLKPLFVAIGITLVIFATNWLSVKCFCSMLYSGVLLTAICLMIEMCHHSPDMLIHFRKVFRV